MNMILWKGEWVRIDTRSTDCFYYTLPRHISFPQEVDFGPDVYHRLKELGKDTPDFDCPEDKDL